MPEALWEGARAEAQASGISTSEFVRQAIAVRLAWSVAIRTVQAGMDPDAALDINEMVARLSRLGED